MKTKMQASVHIWDEKTGTVAKLRGPNVMKVLNEAKDMYRQKYGEGDGD